MGGWRWVILYRLQRREESLEGRMQWTVLPLV